MATIKYSEQIADVEAAKNLGLLPEEFEKIKEILGRTPNFTEVSIFQLCGVSIAHTKTQLLG